MNVLLATDFSPSAIRAREFASSLPFPGGTTLDVVHILDPDDVDVVGAFAGTPRERMKSLERQIARFAAPLRSGDRSVRPRVRVGRPAAEISRHALENAADLVVLGSRGQGSLRATLFGSVTSGVLDRVHIPVLVARTPSAKRIVLADDGSHDAAGAAHQLVTLSLFSDVPVTVVSVVATPTPLANSARIYPHIDDYDVYLTARTYAMEQATSVVQERVAMLRRAGYRTDGEVREGDPARQILDRARELGADLVVVGSRGITGFSRVVLGSVSRRLLGNDQTSLLVARALPPQTQPVRLAVPEEADEVSYEHRHGTPSHAA